MSTEFTVASFAETLNLSKPTIWRYIGSGDIRAYRIGRSVRIPFSELQRIRDKYRMQSGELDVSRK